MSENQEGTTQQEQQGGDNSVIRELRAKAGEATRLAKELEDVKAQNQEFVQKLTSLEREKMGDLERLNAELKDKDSRIGDLNKTIGELSPFKEKVGKWGETFQGLYESKLSSIDESYRPKIEQLSGDGDWPDRLSKLEAAMELLPKDGTTSLGTKGGPSQGSGTTPQSGKKHDMDALAKDSNALWNVAFQGK